MSETEQKTEQKKPNSPVVLALFIVTALVAGMGGLIRSAWLDGKKAGEETTRVKFSVVSSPVAIDFQDSPPVVLKDPKFTKALDYAVTSWRDAMPSVEIKLPGLYQGTSNNCWEGSNARTIACADETNYRIIVQDNQMDSETIDWPSIMMHEVGHLLGVPHIQGDALMNSGYTRKVKSPTAFSVALATVAFSGNK